MNRLTYRVLTSERFERYRDKTLKLCDEQKHDPRLTIFLAWSVVVVFGVNGFRHAGQKFESFWDPRIWFFLILISAVQTTYRELRWIRQQRMTGSN